MSETYSQKLRDPRWQRKRLSVLNRDEWACVDCSCSSRPLEVHHCTYAKEPWDVDDKFLITVCEECHAIRGRVEKRLKFAVAAVCAKNTPSSLEAAAQRIERMADEVPLELSEDWTDMLFGSARSTLLHSLNLLNQQLQWATLADAKRVEIEQERDVVAHAISTLNLKSSGGMTDAA